MSLGEYFQYAIEHLTDPEFRKRAKSNISAHLESNPYDSDALRMMGEILDAEGQPKQAFENYRKALELSPKDYRNISALAEAHIRQAEAVRAEFMNDDKIVTAEARSLIYTAYSKAEMLFRKLLTTTKGPELVRAQNTVALCLYYQGKSDDAVQQWFEVLSKDHTNPFACYMIGGILSARGELDPAIKFIDNCLDGAKAASDPILDQALELRFKISQEIQKRSALADHGPGSQPY